MEFAVLGPLEVRGDTGSLTISRGRPTKLLIALLLRAGRVVPADVLIDQVWGGRPPADAPNALQVQISYLRRALGLPAVGAPPSLRTVAGGYVLDVPPDSIDSHRFEGLVASAAERLTRRSVADAEACLDDLRGASALWRGEPLQDVAFEPFAVAEVDRLRELRATAAEHEFDARLLLGRHEEAVPELRQLIAEFPFRERLRSQLVLALYRSGRQADALRAYGDARTMLAEELGVEPGRELERMRQAVLAQDPALDWAPLVDHVDAEVRPIRRSIGADVAHNLPRSPTPLIGRDSELAELVGLVARPNVRHTTLTGPPGVGKTRLAVEVAWRARDDYPDGVWFADLGGVADETLVPTSVAAAAGVRTEGADSVTAALVEGWQGARVLVVLDNCEHLLPACAALVQSVLGGCPSVSILATSREPLQVRGEHEVPVSPLSVPAVDSAASLDDLAEIPSVALFVARIGEVNPRFALNETNAAATAELCRRLDGLPLALELAARWIRLLTVEELVERLDTSLDVLREGPVDLPVRQRTVRDAVRWSFDLLAPAEQTMFRRLAVFAGGATLDAATEVCTAAGMLGDDPIVLANRLVAASLVQRDDGDHGGPRVRMLAVLREFAAELLDGSTDAEPTRRAHASYFAELARASDEALRGPDRPVWMTRLANGRDNLRAALAWSIDHDVDQGLAMAAALWQFWESRGEREEARSWLESLLAAGDEDAKTPARAWALRCLGNIDWMQSRHDDAITRYHESLAIARVLGDDASAALAISNLGLIALAKGDWSRSRELYEEALDMFRRVGDESMVGFALGNLATAMGTLGETANAASLFSQAIATFERLGDDRFRAWSTIGLAEALYQDGDRERSRALLADGLAAALTVGVQRTIAYALSLGGLVAHDESDHQVAETFLGTALRIRIEELGLEYVAADLILLAVVESAKGQPGRAARTLGAAAVVMSEPGPALDPRFQSRFEDAARALRSVLGDSVFSASWEDGRSSLDTVLSEAQTAATDDLQALIDYLVREVPAARRAG